MFSPARFVALCRGGRGASCTTGVSGIATRGLCTDKDTNTNADQFKPEEEIEELSTFNALGGMGIAAFGAVALAAVGAVGAFQMAATMAKQAGHTIQKDKQEAVASEKPSNS